MGEYFQYEIPTPESRPYNGEWFFHKYRNKLVKCKIKIGNKEFDIDLAVSGYGVDGDGVYRLGLVSDFCTCCFRKAEYVELP